MEKKIQILSTYPLKDELIKNAQQGHLTPLSIEWNSLPFIQTQPYLDKQTVSRIKALAKKPITAIFTSAHAVEAVFSLFTPGYMPNWSVFCLAGKTMDTLLQYLPPAAILATADYGKSLGEKILEIGTGNTTYYFFCGNIRMPTLPELLSTHQVSLEEIKVYKTILTPHQVDTQADAILFFSPSAVRSFFELNNLKKKTVLFSVGDTTSQVIRQFTDNEIITSSAPRVALVIKAVLDYFAGKTPPA